MDSAFSEPVSRRRVLAGAGVAGAGVAALALGHFGPLTARALAASPGTWDNPLHTAAGRTAHLLRRTHFGYTPAELATAEQFPYRDLVELTLTQTPQRPTFANATAQRGRWNAAPVWIKHMAATTAPFPEAMALFWHGILASSDDKSPFEFNYMVVQNQMFRDYGLSDLRTLLIQTALSAAMMEYLDMQQSSAEAPNENFAREFMELFTMGPGNYVERDVRESARSLTGYRIAAFDSSGNQQPWPEWFAPQDAYVAHIESLIAAGWTWRATFDPNLHDATAKTFLGGTGNWQLEDIVDAVLAQPATAKFVARKAIGYFMSDAAAADSTYVGEVAAAFRASDYDIKTLMRTIFLGGDAFAHPGSVRNRFLTGESYRALIRNPIEYIIAAAKATGYAAVLDDAFWFATTMGMELYQPPNVSGWWHGSPYWTGSQQWLARINFASAVAWRNGAYASNPDAAAGVQTQLDGVLSGATASAFAAAGGADPWYVIIGSPEFQLK